MSLWPVSDAVARDTMVAYYARLRAGIGRGDALREAETVHPATPRAATPLLLGWVHPVRRLDAPSDRPLKDFVRNVLPR